MIWMWGGPDRYGRRPVFPPLSPRARHRWIVLAGVVTALMLFAAGWLGAAIIWGPQ